MAIACPVEFDTRKLRAEIQSIYARVAADPSGEFHFHRGSEYASTRLNYDAAELSKLPGTVTESFAGVGNPHAIAPLPAGATVVDIGSGAGTDLRLYRCANHGAVRLFRGHVEGEDRTALRCHRRESVSNPQQVT
jgi:arsenite methyltransferase